MSRARAEEPYVQQKVNIPSTLAARFALLHWDPVLRKVQYGAYSKVMSKLLKDYVDAEEARQGKTQQ